MDQFVERLFKAYTEIKEKYSKYKTNNWEYKDFTISEFRQKLKINYTDYRYATFFIEIPAKESYRKQEMEKYNKELSEWNEWYKENKKLIEEEKRLRKIKAEEKKIETLKRKEEQLIKQLYTVQSKIKDSGTDI